VLYVKFDIIAPSPPDRGTDILPANTTPLTAAQIALFIPATLLAAAACSSAQWHQPPAELASRSAAGLLENL
jgi:hypothetical protein